MPKPTIELPDVPDGWLDAPGGTPPYAPENKPPIASAETRGGILRGWQPKNWTLEDSGLHFLLGPEVVADIDFGDGNGDAGVDDQNPASGHAIVAHEPETPTIRPEDIDIRLPDLGGGPDHRFYSAAGGTVTDAGWENPKNHNQGYGYRVRVRGDDGRLFTYGHTDPNSAQVHVGDKVTASQYLGSYGDPTNGRSTGPHSHLEVRDPSHPLQPGYDAYIKNSRALGEIIDPTPYANTVMPGGDISSQFGKRVINGRPDFSSRNRSQQDTWKAITMMTVRCCVFTLVPLLFMCSAQAQDAISGSTAPSGKWHWYQADFGSVAFVPPIIRTGEATLEIVGSNIKAKLELTPPDKDLHPFFRAKINAKNEVDGVFGGVFMEPQDPARLHGLYRKRPWGKGPCVTETITLQDKDFSENVLVFRRGTPAGC